VTIQLKEEEVYLLNDQIQKLTRSLADEEKQNAHLSAELVDLNKFYKQSSEKKGALIAQLEADNTEIKKRLVKLIK
jgi:predicted RNase H-like nuclease (RuvC/YqgF family)